MHRRSLPLVLVVLAAFAVAACGNKEAVVKVAETEGIYVDVGALDYQVQISRILNPNSVPDSQYLTGLPEDEAGPTDKETWFGVFVRVQNSTETVQTPALKFEIVDTQEKSFEPITLDAKENVFAYTANPLAPGATLPAVDSLTNEGPSQGSMLLFKLPFDTLQNRPLEFKIETFAGEEGVVDLDV